MDLHSLLSGFRQLANEDKVVFLRRAQELLFSIGGIAQYVPQVRERRFADGITCPHCGGKSVKRNGMYRRLGKTDHVPRQRYYCACCGKTFNDLSASPIDGSWYADLWPHYLRLMLEGYSLARTAKELDIHPSTAFYWRHKILRAFATLDAEAFLGGVVEADETFFLESFKGKRNLTVRPPRTRGGTAKKRGLSQEQIAVLTAVDRTGGIVARRAGRGRISAVQIDTVLGPRIHQTSTLVTDKASTFLRFAVQRNLACKQVHASKKIYKVGGVYHIQHVNRFHSHLKAWMLRFRGVATKYLDHYLAWFRMLELTKAMQEAERLPVLLQDAVRPMLRTRRDMFPFADVA